MSNNLVHIKKLEQGNQGVVGLVKVEGKVYVYKISQYMNYLTNHEYLIMNGIKDLNKICPHFCDSIMLKTLSINPDFNHPDIDPFSYNDNPLEMDVLFIEYIEGSISLYSKLGNLKSTTIINLVKQILMGIIFAQRTNDFVHYDLHSSNILLEKCSKDDVFLYVLDNKNAFLVPTYGYIPKIIDYGFGYSKDLLENPLYISVGYTQAGYMSPMMDKYSDVKRFLISLYEDFRENKIYNNNITKFKNMVWNLYKKLEVDWKSGWDRKDTKSIIEKIFMDIPRYTESKVFKKYGNYCEDILQSLITLPLSPKIEESSILELAKCYRVIQEEFWKIEDFVNDSLYSLYIFRVIVDVARPLQQQYKTNPEETVQYFSREVFHRVNKVIPFFIVKNVDYELLLCALCSISQHLEFHIYHALNTKMEEKNEEYNQLPIKSIENIYSLIDINFQNPYTFNNNTVLHICNLQEMSLNIIEFKKANKDFLDSINNASYLSKGLLLYSIFSEQEEDIDISSPDSDYKKKLYRYTKDSSSEEDSSEDDISEDDISEYNETKKVELE